MNRFAMMKRPRGTMLVLAATCVLIGFAAGVLAKNKQMVVRSFDEVRFVPADPSRPDGAQIGVLWGDPNTGPSTMLLKLKKGPGQLHYHTSDYHLSLLQGTMKHWAKGTNEADAKPLGPGSYWFQPGGDAHGDSCLSDECLMFVSWAGKRDGMLADQ